MNKLMLLTRTLRKVGSGRDSADGNSPLSGNSSLVTGILFGGAAMVGLFFLGRFIAGFAPLFGAEDPVEPVFSALFFIAAVMLVFLCLIQLVDTLYMSTDLPVLLSLPFSPRQIVIARTLNTCRLAALLAGGLVIPFGIGFAAAYPGLTARYWIGLLLGYVSVTAYCVCLTGVAVILLLSVFKAIRNRDIMRVAGALLALGLTVGYLLVSQNLNDVNADAAKLAITGAVGSVSGMAMFIPPVPFFARAMGGGSPLYIPAGLGVAAAAVLLYFFVSDRLYLKGALSMQDTGSGKRALTESGLEKKSRRRSVMAACVKRDLRCTLRNPSYMANGWLKTLIWPVFILIGFLGKNSGMFDGMTLTPGAPGYAVTALGMGTGIAAMAAFCVTGLNCLGTNAFSREGKSAYYIKMIPVPYAVQLKAKRNTVLIIESVGSVGFVTVGMIAALIAGVATPFWALYTVALTALLVTWMTNVSVMHGLKKPNLNWESEASITQVSPFGIVLMMIGIIAGAIFFIAMPLLLALLLSALKLPEALMEYAWAIGIALLLIFAGILFLSNRHMDRRADELIGRLI